MDLGTAEGRVTGLRAAAPVVAGIRGRALRGECARELAGWLGMDEQSVRQAVAQAGRSGGGRGGVAGQPQGGREAQYGARNGNQFGPGSQSGPGNQRGEDGGPAGAAPARPASRPGREDPVARLERQVLEVVLQLPHLAVGAGFDDLAPDTFTVPAYRGVHDAIRAAGGTSAYGTELERRSEEHTSELQSRGHLVCSL